MASKKIEKTSPRIVVYVNLWGDVALAVGAE